MISKTLHNFMMLSTLLLVLFASVSVRSQPLPQPPPPPHPHPPQEDVTRQQPVLFIQTNANVEDANNYQFTIEKGAQPGEPCLTISWKTNPDGSGQEQPRIYLGKGYFMISPSTVVKTQ